MRTSNKFDFGFPIYTMYRRATAVIGCRCVRGSSDADGTILYIIHSIHAYLQPHRGLSHHITPPPARSENGRPPRHTRRPWSRELLIITIPQCALARRGNRKFVYLWPAEPLIVSGFKFHYVGLSKSPPN